MERVLVVGAGGTGKSTFARALGTRTGLPVIHLDHHYWRPGWDPTPDHEWIGRVREIVAGDRWIVDGNYGGTLELRAAACDTIIFLDLPILVSFVGIVRRRLKRGGSEQAPGCPERLDREFVHWVATYRRRARPQVLALAAGPHSFEFVRLRSRRAVREYLDRHRTE